MENPLSPFFDFSADYTLFSVRVTHPDILEFWQWYRQHLKQYLDKYSINVIHETIGFHKFASEKHIHIHMVCEKFKHPTNPAQSWRTTYKNNNPAVKLDGFHMLFINPGQKKLCSSLKYTNQNGANINDIQSFLAYPFKEGKQSVLSSTLPDHIISFLVSYANGIYESKKYEKLKQDEKQEKSLGEYQQLINYLDSLCLNNYQSVAHHALKYTYEKRKDDPSKHINPKRIIDYAQKYSFYKGLWTIEEIMENYRI